MVFSTLQNWEQTRDNLHSAAQILGRIRKTFIERQPNALHWSLRVTPDGLSTGKTSIGELLLYFKEGKVIHTTTEGEIDRYDLADPDDVAALEDLAPEVPPTLDGTMNIAVYEKDKISYPVDHETAAAYADTLYTLFTVFSRFRSRLSGTMTPAVVWAHHFDLSFLWFINGEADEHQTPHLNFGFAPFSDGFPRPYIYAYAYPLPEGITDQPLPAPAYWYTDSWKGVVIDYDTLLRENFSEAQIESLLEAIFEVLKVVR